VSSLFRAHILTANEGGEWDDWPDGGLLADDAGRIAWIGPYRLHPPDAGKTVDRRPDLLLPGFIDHHAHVPQLPVCGVHGDSLLDWLHRWIFPLEAGFRGDRARTGARAFFAESLAEGVTTSWLYGSAWPESTAIILEEARLAGAKAFVGHPLMDVDVYRDDLKGLGQSKRTQRVIDEAKAFSKNPRFVATPRFALSCTPELLEACAGFPRLQTHLAENVRECIEVKRRFGRKYAAVYERAGLLKEGAVFAHCIHLERRDKRRLDERGCVRVHCPTSNLFLGSGVMAWDEGRIRLGSDVGGGWTLSPFDVMRCSLTQKSGATPEDLLRAAAGRLVPGEAADFVILAADVVMPAGSPAVEGTHELISRIVYRGSRAAVRQVVVDGNPQQFRR